MPKKVMPSESAVKMHVNKIEFDGRFYIPVEDFEVLLEKHEKARDTINYLLDKWFLTIENRMRDQDRAMTATSRYERAANKISALEKELRELNKTIHELKMEVVKSKPHYRQEWAGQQVCCSKEFKMKFGNAEPTLEEPVKLSGIFFNSEEK
jgi:predicted RNase H-like nuclease (RuvC/YqgF family)